MSSTSPRDPDAPVATRVLLRDRNILSLFAVTLSVVTSVSAVSPAFPTVASALGVSESQIGWVITVYTLPGIALPPLWGVLADRHGRKAALVVGLVVFGAAGGACAFAPGFGWLLALRFVQGIGGAALLTLASAAIGDLYSGPTRVKSLGFNSSVLGASAALYPAIGGALATLSWRYPFALSALALPAALAVVLALDMPEPRDRHDLGEFLGKLLRVARHPEILSLLAIVLLYYGALFGALFTYGPTLLEGGFGVSATVVGVVLGTRSAALAVAGGSARGLAARFGSERLVQIALAGTLVALALFPLLTARAPSVWWLLAPAALMGVAAGLYRPSRETILHAAAPSHLRAAVISVEQSVKRLGQSLGPLALGLVYGFGGAPGTFYAGAAIVGAALALALWQVRPSRSVIGVRDDE